MSSVATSVGAVAAGVLKSDVARNILSRFVRKIWKKIRLKNVACLVVNDCDRKRLKFDYDEDKYQYLDVEAVYLSLLSDGEIARLRELKQLNGRGWIMSVRTPCKQILNNVREMWRNERVILCVSSPELAKELHVSDVTIYVQDEEYHNELMDAVDSKSSAYLGQLRQKYVRSSKPSTEYKSHDKLVEVLNKRFA